MAILRFGLVLLAGIAMTAAAAQTVHGPIAGTPVLGLGAFDRAPPGYQVAEYFLSGTARSFDGGGGETAPFTTRFVVARPADAAKFNGTVVVEWLNVTSGTDAAPDWTYLHRELVRSGYAYVGVSTQRAGLEGSAIGIPGMLPVKKADPQRYESLSHPGDAFAFDIFSQAAAAARGLLKPRQMLAIGESQSAGYLVTYVNAVDPVARVFDGFLIHSRFRSAAPLDGSYLPSLQAMAGTAAIAGVPIRADARVPVLMFITETDLLLPAVGYLPARQPDSTRLRTWEVAGTAHADSYTFMGGIIDTGTVPAAALAKAFTPIDTLFGQQLARPINAAPQHHYVLQAALTALQRWADGGTPPAAAARLDTSGGALVADAVGNAVGGVRSPWVDVPTSVLSGFGQSSGGFATLFGSTMALGSVRLAALYPGGHADYLRRFETALDTAIAAGFILTADRDEIVALADVMGPGEAAKDHE
jgi:hypothetical protein